MVINFKNVSFSYYDEPLLENVNFSFSDKDKIGLIGLNGTGKSTILKLLIDELKPKSGEIIISGGSRINYLSQESNIPKNIKIIDYIYANIDKQHPVEEFEIKSLLSKFNLKYDDETTYLSGGQLKRLSLVKCLLTYSDFLILDEPTNHLDSSMILYLEKYLKKYNHGLFMVTHDRYFLERCCNKIYELDRKKIDIYEANYSKYLILKSEKEELLNKEEAKIKKILKSDHEWMTRGVEARRTKQKYRIERFNKLSKIKFQETKSFEFSSVETYLGKNIIEINHGYKAFQNKIIFKDFTFSLLRYDRIGLVGDNGVGKTTLLKIIMGEETLDSGELKLGETLKIGYFSQHFEIPDESLRVIDYILKDSNEIETLDGKITAKSLLEKFLFDGKEQYSLIKTLSGGQKRRLQLIKILASNPNVLLLDEPTNDLDIYTMELLEDYLNSFSGPIICISHDRFFLDKVCDSILYYENNEIKKYQGSFSSYLEEKNIKNNVTKDNNKIVVKENKKKKSGLSYKENLELNNLEKEIPILEKRIADINNELENSNNDYAKISVLSKEFNNLNKEYELKSTRYMELLEKKEN